MKLSDLEAQLAAMKGKYGDIDILANFTPILELEHVPAFGGAKEYISIVSE